MTPAKPAHDAPIATLPPLVGVILAALASSVAAAWGVANARGWNVRVDAVSLETSALLGGVAVAIGALPGFALLWSPTARSARLIGMRTFASGAARLIIALFLGVMLLVTVNPEGYTFLLALTLATATCLVGEVGWGMSALRRYAASVHGGAVHPNTPGATVR